MLPLHCFRELKSQSSWRRHRKATVPVRVLGPRAATWAVKVTDRPIAEGSSEEPNEVAVAVLLCSAVDEDSDVTAHIIRNNDVDHAVSTQVGERDRSCYEIHVESDSGLKGSIAIAQQHTQVAVVPNDNVWYAISVHIGDGNRIG